MTIPAPLSRQRRAFTLIELLVVIAILAILIALVFPAAQGAFEAAKRAQAKNDATQLATAITGYYTEYGKLPLTGGGDTDEMNTPNMMNLLSGKDVEGDNPREQVFLEVPRAKAKKNGAEDSGGSGNFSSGYYDPWGQLYKIRVDGDYDNKIDVGSGGIGTVVKTVVVWSQGNPDKKSNYSNPAKWIKSWE